MSEGKKRRVHTAEFKAKVGLEAVRGVKTVTEIAQEFGVHPVMVGQWKKEILENAGVLFDAKRGPKPIDETSPEDKLYGEIGRLKMEVDWLKKSWGREPAGPSGLDRTRARQASGDAPVRAGRSAASDGVPPNRCSISAGMRGRKRSGAVCADRRRIHQPAVYGSRRMVVFLRAVGHAVNRKRVQRLMRGMGLAGMAPGPNTSKAHPRHKV